MVGGILNAVRREVERILGQRPTTRIGTITAVDPTNWTARVMVRPDNVETGWLPVGSVAVGSGWGIYAMPSLDDQVEVSFREGSWDAGLIGMRFFDAKKRPRYDVEADEFALIHSSGSVLRFKPDGVVELTADKGLSVYATESISINSPAGVVMGNALHVQGPITATSTITAQSGVGP